MSAVVAEMASAGDVCAGVCRLWQTAMMFGSPKEVIINANSATVELRHFRELDRVPGELIIEHIKDDPTYLYKYKKLYGGVRFFALGEGGEE